MPHQRTRKTLGFSEKKAFFGREHAGMLWYVNGTIIHDKLHYSPKKAPVKPNQKLSMTGQLNTHTHTH